MAPSPSAIQSPQSGLTETPLQVPDVIETVPARGQVDGFSQEGGSFTYSSGADVFAADSEHGTTQLFTADPGFQLMGVDSDLGYFGLVQAWAEGRYDKQNTGQAPCSDQGAIAWRLFVDTDSGITQVASGTNSRVTFCSAQRPLFALDGDTLAYAVETPRDGHPQAWQIQLTNIFSGATTRTIDTDEDIFSLDLANGDVAYTEGTLDADVDPYNEFATRLMLDAPGDAAPRQIGADAYDVSFDQDRLTWIDDQSTSQRSDNAPGPQILTATLGDLTPQALGPEPGPPWQSVESAGDLVTWVENDQVVVASPNHGMAWRVTGLGTVLKASARYDQLAWLSLNDDGSQSLDSIPTSKVLPRLPTPSAAPSPSPSGPPPTLAPAVSIVVGGTTWQRLDAASLPTADYLWLKTTNRGHLYGIGTVNDCPGSDQGCSYFFSSIDGVSWTPLGKLPQGAPFYSIYENAAGELFTGVGPGIWHSSDGSSWQLTTNGWGPLAAQCLPSSGEVAIQQIIDTGSGIFGFGSGAWRSDDALNWQCLGNGQSPPVAYVAGTFVAWDYSAASDSDAGTLLASADGVNWHDTQYTSTQVTPVAVADGLVALHERVHDQDPDILYTTSNGQTWHRRASPFGDTDLNDLVSDGTRAAVLEDHTREPLKAPGAVWISSPDGTQWSRYELPLRDGDEALALAIVGDLVVVSGTHYGGDATGSTPVVWAAQIP